jgi:hypothetical protein
MGLIDADAYEERTRVHALNVLRLIILDAPLSSEVLPLVGDAIISAIMGYLDPAWTIRNSSTMVFAAAMLRVVDADKNAANVGKTSKNAISVTELFRSYPALSSFLRSVLECTNRGVEQLLHDKQCAMEFVPGFLRALDDRTFAYIQEIVYVCE